MIVSVKCTMCKDKHHDHYECSECKRILSGVTLPFLGNQAMKFCPFCGKSLKKRRSKLGESK